MAHSPSIQAIEAIRCAQRARHQSEYVVPIAESLAEKSRELRENNHFRELIEESMKRKMEAER